MSAPAEQSHLRVVDGQGEVHDYDSYGCPRCKEVQIGDVQLLETRCRKLERHIKNLERDKQAERELDPNRWEVKRLIELWKEKTNHPRARISADRFDMVKARLAEGYEVEEVELAIEGLAAYPYVNAKGRSATGKRSERHDRLGIALTNGEALERFANMGHEVRKEAL